MKTEALYIIGAFLMLIGMAFLLLGIAFGLNWLFICGLCLLALWIILLTNLPITTPRIDQYFDSYFSPGLEHIRNKYEQLLKAYFKEHEHRTYLINEYCEARLVAKRNKHSFYIKQRHTGYFNILGGKFIEISGSEKHVTKMWTILDMEFRFNSTYDSLKKLYWSLQGVYNAKEIPRHYVSATEESSISVHENFIDRLPKPEIHKSAQNEFCRMEIQTLQDKEKVIICSEIWGTPDYDKPKKFVIKAKKYVLYEIITEFTERKNKLENYSELLEQYSNRSDCKVETLEDLKNQQIKQSTEEITQNTKETKIEEQDQDENKEYLPKDNLPHLRQENLPLPKRYDERNLDL